MDIKSLKLEGTYLITLDPRRDQRGFLMRAFDSKIFEENSLPYTWVQENQSNSLQKGIIRGLHFQFPPFTESKMVRVVSGSILDVFVDLRKNSLTYGQSDSVILSAENNQAVVIAKGLAHGFCTLTDNVIMIYHHDNFYSKEHENGVLWNDKNLAIDWPIINPILSDRDRNFQTFKEFDEKYHGL